MKNPSFKNIGLIGAGAVGTVALTLGAATIVGAQEDDPSLDGPTSEEGHEDRHQARIDRLVEDGVITQEQADTLGEAREAIQAEREARRAEKLQGIADVLGVTVEDLQAARANGESLVDVAGDNLDDLVAHLSDEATAKINEAVAEGRITQEQADEKLDGLSERIEQRLESGEGFGRKGHGRKGHHGPRDIDPTAAVPDRVLERLADAGVDVDGIDTFEDLQALRESGALDDLGIGRPDRRGFGPQGFGPGGGDAPADVEVVQA